MEAVYYVRFALGMIFILVSVVMLIIQIMGVFKMKYVLNRMHLAAIGDTVGLMCAFIGLMIINGLNFVTFKLFIVPLFMFFSSPVSSHLIARMEVETTDKTDEFYKSDVNKLSEAIKKEGNS